MVPRALAGDLDATRRYVSLYERLLRRLLARLVTSETISIIRVEGKMTVVDPEGNPVSFGLDVLRHSALSAPFSPWVSIEGPGMGVALAALNEVLDRDPESPPLAFPSNAAPFPHWETPDAKIKEFTQRVWFELNRSTHPLLRVIDLFGLSITSFARLFGVKRQALARWIEKGIPPGRQQKAKTISAIADLLDRKLKTDRVPAVVRQPADAYGGLSMLEMIETDKHEELLEDIRKSFDWAATA